MPTIPDRYYINLKGRQYPVYEGVLVTASENGLRCLETSVVQVPNEQNGWMAVVMATATFDGPDGRDRVFTDVGDCSPKNCSATIATAALRMASCVPLSAEILTRKGWKNQDALVVGEEVLAYDCEADCCRWTPLLAVSRFDEEYPTVRLTSRSCSFVCTPDHTWAVHSQYGRRRLVRTRDLNTAHGLIQAAPTEDGPSRLSPREAAILGWLATDGNVRECMVTDRYGTFGPYLRATIYQSKPAYIPVIRALLGDDARETIEPPTERDFSKVHAGGRLSQCKTAHRWSLKTSLLKRLYAAAEIERLDELPSLVLRLSHSARAAMLEAFLQAEGHHKGGGRWVFCQRKEWVMEAFVLLATLEGRALGASRVKGARPDLRALRSNRLLTASYLVVEDEGAQPVWCPTTQYGTWIMRQNGMVTITGNTRAKGRVLRDGIGLGQTLAEELPDEETAPSANPARPARPGVARDAAAHPARPDAGPNAAAPTAALEPYFCSVCGVEVPAEVARHALKHFGTALCVVHGKAELAAQRAAADQRIAEMAEAE